MGLLQRPVGARAVVVGHSVTGTGRIEPRFGGRVIGIDAGMGEGYGGSLAALEVGPDGSLAALYEGGREEIVKPAAAARVLPRLVPGLPSGRLANASR